MGCNRVLGEHQLGGYLTVGHALCYEGGDLLFTGSEGGDSVVRGLLWRGGTLFGEGVFYGLLPPHGLPPGELRCPRRLVESGAGSVT